MKRVPVKYVRDIIKKDFIYGDKCFICEKTDNLELHHLYSLSDLFNDWMHKNKIPFDEINIKKSRYIFYEEFKDELSQENCYTLCKTHHSNLHAIYGLNYHNTLVPKIKNWILLQKEKLYVKRTNTLG